MTLHLVLEVDPAGVELVELGLDAGLREVGDRHDALARLERLAGLRVPGDDDAVDRREDAGLREDGLEAVGGRRRGLAPGPRGVDVALGLVDGLPRADVLLPEGARPLDLGLGEADVGVGLDDPGLRLREGGPVVVRPELGQELAPADLLLLLHLENYDRPGQVGSDDDLGPGVGHDAALGRDGRGLDGAAGDGAGRAGG